MKQILISTGLFFLLQHGMAQSVITKQWEAFHNGTLSGKDISNCVAADSAGNIFITGKSFQTSAKGDLTTVMYDTAGNLQWIDFYVSSGTGSENRGNKILVDRFQRIYAIGTSQHESGDIAIARYNATGRIWAKDYTSSLFGSYIDEGKDLGVDSSGNVYAVGMVTSTSGNLDDVYTFKLDSTSDVLWDMQYTGASAEDYPRAIAVTNSGESFSLNTSYNFFGSSTYDITTIHYDPDGMEEWISRFNGEGDDFDMAVDINIDAAGIQYVSGATLNADDNNDIVAWKQNDFGTRLWTKIYNGSANDNDTAISALALQDGKTVVLGRSVELLDGSTTDAMTLILLDADGNTIWTKNYYGVDSNGAIPYALTTDSMGGIYIAGLTYSLAGQKDGLVMKYDTSGALLWMDTFDGAFHWYDLFTSIVLDNKENIIVTGQTYTSGSSADFVTIKYGQVFSADTTTTDTSNNDTTQTAILTFLKNEPLLLYPDPAADVLHVMLKNENSNNNVMQIFGADGVLYANIRSTGKPVEDIDVRTLPEGLYFLHIRTAAGSATQRFVISR